MAKFIKVYNFLQAKALLEHDYAILIGNPLFDMPVYICYLKGSVIICAEYTSPSTGILRYGDWGAFEELFTIALEADVFLCATLRYW